MRWKIKLFISVIIILMYNSFMSVQHLIGSYLSVDTLNPSDSAYIAHKLFTGFVDNLFLIVVLAVVLLMWTEIKKVYRWIRKNII